MVGIAISKEKKKAIQQLMEAGFRNSDISKMLNVSRPTVCRYREIFGYPSSRELNKDDYDLQKWELLKKYWPPKKPAPPKPKRKPTIKTPYNYFKFGKEEPNDN